MSGRCAGDWMGMTSGNHVRERGGRHVGRVQAIFNSATVKVRWENGWLSEFPLGDLERLTRREMELQQ
jgi:hypothetical protein